MWTGRRKEFTKLKTARAVVSDDTTRDAIASPDLKTISAALFLTDSAYDIPDATDRLDTRLQCRDVICCCHELSPINGSFGGRTLRWVGHPHGRTIKAAGCHVR